MRQDSSWPSHGSRITAGHRAEANGSAARRSIRIFERAPRARLADSRQEEEEELTRNLSLFGRVAERGRVNNSAAREGERL